jgi:plasmid stabilization system protein ParE
MAVVRWLPPALEDLARLVEFLRNEDPRAAGDTARLIFEALRVLEKYPLIGRTLRGERRELVIYRGRTGYLAQYEYHPATDEVVILAVRHQRELEG